MKVLTCPNCGMIDFKKTRQGKIKCVTCGSFIKLPEAKTNV